MKAPLTFVSTIYILKFGVIHLVPSRGGEMPPGWAHPCYLKFDTCLLHQFARLVGFSPVMAS